MREPREPLGVRVAEEDQEGHGGEGQRQAVQAGRGGDENGQGGPEERPDEGHRERARRQRPIRGARVGCVDSAVRQPVVSHGGASGAHHGGQDLSDDRPRRPSAGREHHGEQGERQRKESVRELDHRERRRELAGERRAPRHRRRFPRGPAADPVHRYSASGSGNVRSRAARMHHASRKRSTEGVPT